MIAAGIVVADQASKAFLIGTVAQGDRIVVTPFFNVVHVYNTGAAFSFLAGASGWQREFFIGIALVASVWITWMLVRHSDETRFALALALILGGAIGNVIDRVHIGAVVDFVQLHAFGYAWPAFNVADSAITVGAVVLAIEALIPRRTDPGP